MSKKVCLLNEDCIAGLHDNSVPCRYPTWTSDVRLSESIARLESKPTRCPTCEQELRPEPEPKPAPWAHPKTMIGRK